MERRTGIFWLWIFVFTLTWGVTDVGWGETAERALPISPITVTAERFPVEEKESPRFVTVVSSEELKETGGRHRRGRPSAAGRILLPGPRPFGISTVA